MATQLKDLVAVSYQLPPGARYDAPTLDRVGQIEGPDLWAVRRLGRCLNRDGEWEYEPRPSSRDDAFKARCRFATPEEALAAWDAREADPHDL